MDIVKDLRVSVTEAFESSFDNALKRLQSEIAVNQASLEKAKNDAAIANTARQAAECRIQDLQREVAALQEELNHQDSGPADPDLSMKSVDFENEFSPEHIWGADLEVDQLREILENKYMSLYDRLQDYRQSWGPLKAKLMQHKTKLRLYQQKFKNDKFTLDLDGEPVTFERVQNSKDDHNDHAAVNSSSFTRRSLPPKQGISLNSEQPIKYTQNRSGSADTTPVTQTINHSLHASFSDETEPCLTQSSPGREPDSSESPSDILPPLPNLQKRKRKRAVNSSEAPVTASKSARPILVKDETFSSSPQQHSAYVLGPSLPSTQDLDDIGDTVMTPTKRHAHRAVHWDDTSSRELNHGQSSFNVLQPIDGNMRSAGVPKPKFGDKGKKFKDLRAILSITEDGDVGDSDAHPYSTRCISVPPTMSLKMESRSKLTTKDRLEDLLEKSQPSKSPLTSSRGMLGRNITPKKDSRTAKSIPFQPPSVQNEESESQLDLNVHPDDEPYRSRPLHRLTLDHFKINPQKNDGLDYAYSAVVRKKDDRKCLTGCTRPECCGGRFRAMARLGGFPAKSPSEQQEEDQRLLEEYMGEDYHMLEGLSAEDRGHLLIEARARAIANQYGKHRHAHQRARSPPGFWRTDMPSTQELESDREVAQRIEREKIEERYREAMRPGGLWTWADE
ncbi:hypothetical protein N7466_006988 [Penicillium verhagenii]|uniref:uncharacterized protein n=1 Tax=Penicillium verhagenii TaxID=1562060 RepID=UPI002545475A|nr:uncharacterized protein N7466_006988 [Penicillium verhagenii]KAJ5928032.1 hypothetical protein N7466_006988 [Penicillium verhagenii]